MNPSGPDLSALWDPIDVGRLRMRNRLAMSGHTGALPHERYLGYLAERAAGGVGLIVVGGANAGLAEYGPLRGMWAASAPASFDFVGPNPATANGIAYFDDLVVPLLRERADVVRAGGALSIGQVFHLGAYREVDTLQVGIGPSAGADPDGFGTTYELTSAEIDELTVAYAAGVHRTKLAGLDGAEIHAAHGFLINSFLSPLTNRREDEWGGDLPGRARFLVRILERARETVGPDFPIGLRVAAETAPAGLSVADLVALCLHVEPFLAYVSVSGGTVSGVRGGLAYASTRFDPVGHNLDVAAELRAALRVPVMAAGQLLSAERAAAAIAAGQCDIAAMARPFIADPSWPVKIAQGRGDEVRPCIRANECHMYHGMRAHMTCAVNPEAGREREFAIALSSRPIRVLVVGGGPAGMQAASVAAQSGHRVTLIERAEQLGGRLPLIARDPSQHRLADYVASQRSRLARLGVEIRLGVDLPAAELVADNPAVVLVATGSSDPAPALGGTADVQTYAAVLAGVPIGRHVLVVGGLEDHLEPLSAADLLATRGHQVVAVTEWDRPAPHADPMTRMALLRRLRGSGVELALGLQVLQMHGRTVELLDVLTGQPPAPGLVGQWPEFDTVVYCGGRTARTDLLRGLRAVHPQVQAIGDCLAPRRIVHAVLDGQRAGRMYEIGQQHLLRP